MIVVCEADVLFRGVPNPSPGTRLQRFIGERADGNAADSDE
jgi:hypothetical protein